MDVPLPACVFDTSSWTFAGVYCGARVSSDAGVHDGLARADGGQAVALQIHGSSDREHGSQWSRAGVQPTEAGSHQDS